MLLIKKVDHKDKLTLLLQRGRRKFAVLRFFNVCGRTYPHKTDKEYWGPSSLWAQLFYYIAIARRLRNYVTGINKKYIRGVITVQHDLSIGKLHMQLE